MTMQRGGRILAACACLALASLLLACITLPLAMRAGASAGVIPRWACPTPTPQLYGQAGPVKDYRAGPPDPTSGIAQQEPIYYQQWEQEDFDLGGAPFPAPTPYAKIGSSFYLGQLVNLAPQLDARATVRRTELVSGSLRLYVATLEWKNRGAPFTFAPARQLLISAVQRPSGARVGGDGWGWSRGAALLAGLPADLAALGAQVSSGASAMLVPILAPDGEAQTLDLRLDLLGAAGAADTGEMRVQWLRAREPHCGQDGTEAAFYPDPAPPVQGLPPPVSAGGLLAFAEAQVGRPYCWGGKGWDNCDGYGGGARQVTPSCSAQGGSPCWDCSGLVWGAYKAANLAIGHGTSNQSQYPAVWRAGDQAGPAELAQPGDLLLFTGASARGRPAGSITHVGLYAGGGLMIHAANYPDGVIETPNVFSNRYYAARLMLITRPPRAG